jgi:hypothetical protein
METTNHRVAGVEGGRIVNDGAVNNANVNKANVNEALGFEIFKHLTTLNAGSIVLIGTFLGDIFPHDKHGNLTIDQLTTGLIAASFLLFGVSLVASTFSMYQFAHFETWWSGMIKSSPSGNWFFDGFVTLARLVAGSVFFLGVVCFGAAVLWSL